MRKLLSVLVGLVTTGLTLAQCPPGSPLSTPYYENFDTVAAGQTGGFSNCWTATTTSDPNWESESSGTTNSSSTGPINDYSGSGNYVYLETSSGSEGDTAGFISPEISLTGLTNPELSFYYHMYGSTMGDLKVYIGNGTSWDSVWALSGEQQTAESADWRKSVVDLSSYSGTIRVKFLGSRGSDYYGDMAIDEISIAQAPACPQPSIISFSNITSSSADLNWNAVTSATTGYELMYGAIGFDPATAGMTSTTVTNSITLSSLASNTGYDVYIISSCASNGSSDTTGPLSFATPCASYPAPYFNDFESDALDDVPACWSYYETYSSSWVEVEDHTGASAPYSGSQALYFYSGFGSTTDTLMAITPQLSGLTAGDKQLRFYANSDDPVTQLIVGTITNPSVPSSFSPIDTIVFPTPDTYQEVILPITTANGYNGTDEYIALAHNMGATYDYIRVDDFNYEVIPACPKVSAIVLDSVDVTSASFSFTGSGTSYDVEFGPTGFTQGTGCTGSFTSTSITIDNNTNTGCATQLAGNTTYDIYIRNNCSAASNGTSIWEGPFTFTTACDAITSPYTQNFDGTVEPELDNCWSIINNTSSSASFVGTENLEHISSPNSLELFNSSATSGDLIAVSPMFSDLDNTKRIRFSTYDDDDASDLIIGTLSDPSDPATFTPFQTITAGDMDNDAWELFVISFATYTGTDKYIGFKHGMNTTSDNIYIDDFEYQPLPACVPPVVTSLGAYNVSYDMASIYWAAGSQGVKTYIELGTSGFIPGTSSYITLDSVSGSKDTLNLIALAPQTTYEFYIQDSCATSGLSPWVGPYSFTTSCAAISTPHTESFDSTSIPSCWTTYSSTNEEWTFGSNTYAPSSDNTGNGGEYATVDDSESPATPDVTLVSPFFDVSSLTNPELEFYLASQDATVTLRVDVWDGSSWNNGVFTHAAATTNTWDKISVNLIPYAGSGEIAVRFIVDEDNGTFQNDIAIDDVSIKSGPTCPNPGALTALSVVDTSAILNWVAASASNSNEVWFGPQGFFQGTQSTTGGTLVVVNNDSLLVDTLTGNTCYEFLVRGFCGTSDTSAWVGPFSFCTPCSPFTAPYYENFDAASTPDVPDCWTAIESSSSSILTVTSTDHGTPIPSAPNAIEFNIGSGNDPVILVSPELTDLSTGLYHIEAEIAFEGFGDGFNDTLYVGTMSSPYDTASFIHYDTVLLESSNGSFQQFRFYMDNTSLIGTNSYVAFKYGNAGGNWEYYIDNFAYELTPSCPDPYALGASDIGTTTTEVYWTGAGSGNWEIEYGTEGFALGSGTPATSTNDTTTLTGLSSATVHDFYVREDCGSGSYSNWVGPFTFLTNCAPTDKLLGTYTIDNSQPTAGTNFNSFEDATAALNLCGVRGDVTFNIAAGTYSEALILTEIAGVTADSTVTFNGGSAANVILTYSSANDTPTVYLNGADYITLKNMTIENTSTSDGWGVMLQDSADFNTIDSCIINMPITTTTDIIGIVASNSLSFETSTGGNTNNLTVSNSKIIGGETGIHLEGSSSAPYNYGNMIINNTFVNQDDHGIEVDGQEGLVIKGNSIDSLQNTQGDGIYLANIDDFEVSENMVISPDYGIYINDGNDGYSPSANSIVANNMVISSSDYALYLLDFESVNIFHNTLSGEPAIRIDDQIGVDIRNNIFVSSGDYAFESTDALTANDVVDYNLYYSTNTDAFDIGPNTYIDLAAWQAGDATRNQNSVEGDPVFAGANDLHVVGPLANDVGDNTVGITTDIDGDIRPASGSTTVDMGADEYTPLLNDLSAIQILDPKNNGCGDSSNTVTVIIQNLGLQSQSGFNVVANISGAVTATLSTTYSGTLNSLQIDTVTLSSFNGVLGGVIAIDAYTDLSSDQDNSNDTIFVIGINLNDGLAPVPTAALDTVCGAGAFDTLYYPAASMDMFYWLDANNDTIGSTDSLVVGPLSNNDTTFYIQAAGNISHQVGPVDNTIGAGGNFANTGVQQMYFTASTTIVIDSFAVYPNGAGNVVVNLKDQNGNTLQTTSVAVTGTGKTMIPVGFIVSPGSYELDGDGSTTGGLYRNSAGASYPYSVPGVIDITGNSFGAAYYYYFYDWHITAQGCSKPQGSITIYNDGITVNPSFTATPGSATSTDLTVTFDASATTGATSYSWDFGDGNSGTGVNTQHTYTANGTYTVKLVASGLCGADSTTQTVLVQGINLEENILSSTLEVYPNPTDGKISIEVNTDQSTSLTIQLMDASGRVVEQVQLSDLNGNVKTEMDLSEVAKGIYILQLSNDEMSTSRQIIKN